MSDSFLPQWVTSPNPDLYLGDDWLILDFETTNKDYGSALNKHNRLVCSGWKFRGKRYRLYAGEMKQQLLLQHLEECSFLVAHNAKFELQWLQRCGLDLTKIIIYDTQIGEYVLLGNRRAPLDLDSLGRRYGVGSKGDTIARLIDAGVCPSEMPDSWVQEYNDIDVDITEAVFLKQRQKLRDLGLLPTMYTRCLLTPVLADIEQHGMMLDADRVTRIYQRLSCEYNELLVKMNALTGGINTRSPKQVAEFLYDRLGFPEPKKGRGTGKDVVLALKPTTDEQREFLELKKKTAYLEAKLSKSFQKFVDCLNDEEEPGILKFQFNQTVTQTHRLSSSGRKYKIQGQNLDREVKPVFKARRDGWKIAEADQAQLEFRAAAFLSQDVRAMQSILDKEDVHKFTATQINGVGLSEVTDDMRQNAKSETFKPLYGGEYGTPEQMAYYKAFRLKYPELADTQNGWTYEVLNTGKLVTATGLIFYWTGTKMDRRGQIENKRSIYNYPIQSIATADIVPIGVVCLWHRMKSLSLQSFMINTVHDSAIVELSPEEGEIFEELSRTAFVDDTYAYLKDCYGIEWNVPLEVETSIDSFWKNKESWEAKWLKAS